MDSQFIRKIMFDSRFVKSGTPGNFTFKLNRAITLPSKCAGFITDIELVHSSWTVDDHNEYLYFYEAYVEYSATPIWRLRYHRAAVTKQNWAATALTAELQTKLNAPLVNGQRSITTDYDPKHGANYVWDGRGGTGAQRSRGTLDQNGPPWWDRDC